ncbi:MAG TPA: MFS transporter [Caulobacteraceae bacterium]|jgi:AAHS family 3-hydroxyphenylpropionic acid transporter
MAAIGLDLGVRRMGVTLGLCFCAALAEGFDVQSIGVAAPKMVPALALGRDQLGFVFSASTLGLMVGALVVGRLADRVGRKWSLIASVVLYGVFSAVTALAWNLDSVLIVRFLTGLGIGGAMPTLIALAAEATPENRRARTVTFICAGFPFGSALAATAATLLGWRGIFLAGGVAPLALAPMVALLMPESRDFLWAREARRAAARDLDPPLSILFGSGRAPTTLLLWGAFFAALLSLYLLINWLPTLMVDKGVAKSSASLVSVLFNTGGGVGVMTLSALMTPGRRARILAAIYAGLTVALIALAGVKPDLASAGVAAFAVGLFVGFTPLALYGLAPGYYAVAMRGAGVGAAVAAGRVGAIVGPLMAAALLGVGLSGSGVLLALLPLVAVTAGATLTLLGRPTVAD